MNIKTASVAEVSEMPSCDRSVICRLMTEGSYEMLVARIFSHLDLVSLTACGRVSSLWRTCISAILNTCPRALRLDTQHLSRWQGRTATVRSVVLPTGEEGVRHSVVDNLITMKIFRIYWGSRQTKYVKATFVTICR